MSHLIFTYGTSYFAFMSHNVCLCGGDIYLLSVSLTVSSVNAEEMSISVIPVLSHSLIIIHLHVSDVLETQLVDLTCF